MCDSKFLDKLNFACVFLLIFTCTWKRTASVEIDCIPLKSCPTALKLVLTAKQTPETTEFLKISHCGVDKKNQPMVWCSQLNFCVTPQNKNGTCTPLEKCKPFIKMRSAIDISNPDVNNFLNKFRCNEILEEPYVCCQNEPFDFKNQDPSFTLTTTRPKPAIQGRFITNNYEYYDLENRKPFDESNFHDYYDTFQPHHRMDSSEKYGTRNSKSDHPEPPFNSDYGENDNKWTIPSEPHRESNTNFEENNYGTENHHRNPENFQGNDYLNNKEVSDNSNKSSRGPKDVTTPKNKMVMVSYTTERTRNNPTSGKRNRGVVRDDNTRIIEKQKNRSNKERTTSSARRTTPSSYERTTTKRNDFDSNVGDGRIIFEDSFQDLLQGKSRSTTEEATRSGDRRRSSEERNRNSCETPDSKPGICTRPNSCQRYTILQKNLDRSLKSVRDYLEKFNCDSKGEICCQNDEEKAIDNSVLNVERTGQNEPDPISKICGRQTASTDRIVGGSMADLGEFPWLALLQYPSKRGIQSGCGGTLINSRYVVTAAHCVDEQILKNRDLGQVRQLVLGEYDTRNKTDCIYMSIGQDCADPPKTYRIESIIPHKMYNSTVAQHDIALLRLDQDVQFTDYIKPICLPTKSSSLRGNETFDIAGWGRTSTDMFSPILRKAKIPSVSKESCNTRDRSLLDGQICAGLGNGTDSCNGDSGGPLMLRVTDNFEFVTHLMGVISYGFLGCGRGPSINTYVPFYIDWIDENMNL